MNEEAKTVAIAVIAAHEHFQMLLDDDGFPDRFRHDIAVALDLVTQAMEVMGVPLRTAEQYRAARKRRRDTKDN